MQQGDGSMRATLYVPRSSSSSVYANFKIVLYQTECQIIRYSENDERRGSGVWLEGTLERNDTFAIQVSSDLGLARGNI